jgi:hypothetical protein
MTVDGWEFESMPMIDLDASKESLAHFSSDSPGIQAALAPYSAYLTVVFLEAVSPVVSSSVISASIRGRTDC